MEKTQAIVLSIITASVGLYIFLLTQICKSCGSLKRTFLWDEFTVKIPIRLSKLVGGDAGTKYWEVI